MGKRRIKQSNSAVSELLDTVLLLGIAIALFSVVSIIVLSYPFNPSTPSANIIGFVDGKNIILEHRGGEPLSLDTKILIKIGDQEYSPTAKDNLSDTNGDGYWSLDERFVFNPGYDISNADIGVTVVDVASNSVVMMAGGIQGEGATIPSLETHVDAITPYWKKAATTITATASDTTSGVKNVTLYYRFSTNNNTWGGYVSAGVDTASPWSWSFSFTNGTGYYQFYSIAKDNAANAESAPGGNGDRACGYDNVAPASSVNAITPYWKKAAATITATASDATSGVKNVTLYYRFSSNNASWGGWVSGGVDTASPWSWSFTFSNGTGYYQFYSIAKDNAANAESAPGSADARCYYAPTEYLYVNGFTSYSTQWTGHGSSPYLGSADGTNYISTATDGYDERWFTFADTSATSGTLVVNLSIYVTAGDGDDDVNWYIDTTGDNTAEFSGTSSGTRFDNPTSGWYTLTISGLDTVAEVNAARVQFEYHRGNNPANTISIDCARLGVYRAG